MLRHLCLRDPVFFRRCFNFKQFHSISQPTGHLDFYKPSFQLTFVRFKKVPVRKPTWMPRAKTKLFIFRKIEKLSEDEADQIRELRSHYNTEMESIMAYCAAENEKLVLQEHPESDQKDFAELLLANEQENERIARIRESVMNAELASEKQILTEETALEDQWLAAKKEEVEKIVKYEKAQSLHFVNLDNLEHAISEAIDNPVNYNFAINLDGKILWEEKPHPDASPFWADSIPHEKLSKPPSRPPYIIPPKKKKKEFNSDVLRWC